MPVLRFRLALHGCLNRPFYHIVVATNTSKRDGKHLEQVIYIITTIYIIITTTINTLLLLLLLLLLKVGCYDPMPNYNQEVVVGLNIERIK